MNIGLVLSGGMAKGAYQIGALKALQQFIPMSDLKYISCASVGVLNGFAFATGKLTLAEQMWNDICCNDSRRFISQILRSSLLQQNIKDIFSETDILSSSFYCSLLDVDHMNIVYKDLSTVDALHIPQYLKASVSMPFFNRSVQINDTSYFDGALVDNIPVFPLLKHNLDYIICIYFDDFCYKFENTYFDNKLIKITFPGQTLFNESVVLRKDHIQHMISDGFDQTTDILSSIFYHGHDDIEHIYKMILHKNLHSHPTMRITGDVIVTNLNKVAQKFTKKKIR